VSGLGVKRDLIEANLLFASAQRLVPKNCPHCVRDDVDAAALVNAVFGESLVPKTSVGCESCNFTGVKGRVLFFEHIARETVPETNQKQLVQQGSLKSCALEALRKGEVNAQNACAFD
jgi:type IV pilus assembly protein PilB